MRETPQETSSGRRYMLELGGAMLLYAVVLLPAVAWVRGNPASALRWAVGLIPLLPALLAAWAVLRFFRRMDELGRKKLTEGLAFAFAASALFVLTLGFLQVAGLPSLSVWWIWVGMGAFWLVGCGITELRYR